MGLILDAAAALTLVDSWMKDDNTVTRTPDWATDYRPNTFCPNPSRVRFNGVTPIKKNLHFSSARVLHSRDTEFTG